MSDQFGFDFADDVQAFAEAAPGTWLRASHTAADYRVMIEQAGLALLQLKGPTRALFQRALEAAQAELTAVGLRKTGTSATFVLRLTSFDVDADDLAAFIALIEAAPHGAGGHEHKVRRGTQDSLRVAMFVPQLGTLHANRGPNGAWVDFELERGAFFMDSFRDGCPIHKLAAHVFRAAYCADKLAASDRQRAAVPTFSFGGREYVNTGGMSHDTYAEVQAWTIRPLADWHGATFSYREQCAAYSAGTIERGDHRGLVVTVRGVPCVLESQTHFYDDDVKRDDRMFAVADVDEPDIDEDDDLEADAGEE